MKKFKMLESEDFMDTKLITLDSFINNYPKFIGTNAMYFLESVYRVIAGPKYEDVTKLRFL